MFLNCFELVVGSYDVWGEKVCLEYTNWHTESPLRFLCYDVFYIDFKVCVLGWWIYCFLRKWLGIKSPGAFVLTAWAGQGSPCYVTGHVTEGHFPPFTTRGTTTPFTTRGTWSTRATLPVVAVYTEPYVIEPLWYICLAIFHSEYMPNHRCFIIIVVVLLLLLSLLLQACIVT